MNIFQITPATSYDDRLTENVTLNFIKDEVVASGRHIDWIPVLG